MQSIWSKKLLKNCARTGVGLLIISVLMFLSVLTGFLELNNFDFLGHSGLRSIAGVAVAGCMLAAIGYHDQ